MKTYHYRLPEGRNIQSFERSKTTCLVIFKINNNMDKLVKQLPLVALLLAFTVFVGKAAVQALNTSSTTMWVYNPSKGPETNPNSYDPAPPNADPGDCLGQAQVCVIETPEGVDELEFSPELINAITNRAPHEGLTYGALSAN